jgi:hypothetical protein
MSLESILAIKGYIYVNHGIITYISAIYYQPAGFKTVKSDKSFSHENLPNDHNVFDDNAGCFERTKGRKP